MSIPTLLRDYLSSCESESFTITFSELEAALGARLPASARKYQAYWSTGNSLGRLLLEAGWRAAPKLFEQRITFSRTGSSVARSHAPGADSIPGLVLIGCVKTKRSGQHAARDLYSSSLFRGRMSRALATGAPWFVLSAKYGLLHPDDEVESYDETLLEMSGDHRRRWAQHVLEQIATRFGSVRDVTVEIHAGYEYRASGLVSGLVAAGARVSVPLEGLGLGEQPAWYGGTAASATTSTPKPSSPARAGAPPSPADPEESQRIAMLVAQDFMSGAFDLAQRAGAPIPGWSALPEFVAAEAIRERGAGPAQVRRFCTFVAAMDRARDADLLWQRGTKLYGDEPWVFDPVQVVGRNLRDLREALARYGVSQRHGVDSASWRLIAEALVAENSPNDVRIAVEEGTGDASRLLAGVRALTDTGQPWYPLLSGPKVSVMWVRMLAAPGDAEISNLSLLPVAVDVQVRKVTEYLGVADTAGRDLEDVRDVIQGVWSGAAGEAVGPGSLARTAAALDPALWFMGKWGCTVCERRGARLPIGRACAGCRFVGRSG